MNEIEIQLQQYGASFLSEADNAVRLQIETNINLLKQNPEFCLALCNLISNPQTPSHLFLFYINIAKDESKYLFSSHRKCLFGKHTFEYRNNDYSINKIFNTKY